MPYYKLLTGTHRTDGKTFKVGDVIEISDEKAERMGKDRVQYLSDSEPKKPKYDFEHWAVGDVLSLIESLDTVEEIRQVEEAERTGKNRVSIIRAAQNRIAGLD